MKSTFRNIGNSYSCNSYISSTGVRYPVIHWLYLEEMPIRSVFIVIAISILVLAGFWMRVRNLGSLGLIGDEGIQALAVKGILEHGIPKVETGYVYTRALPFLYIQAAIAKMFELNAFWLRFPSSIFGIAVIVPCYFLGKLLFSQRVGLLAAAILAFSLWEIELSRYARFYTAFQFAFLLSLICFYKGFIREEKKYKILFLLAALFAYSTHALGNVIIVLFLIPIIYHYHDLFRNLIIGLWAVATVILFKAYDTFVKFISASNKFVFAADEKQLPKSPAFLEKVRTGIGLPRIDMPDMTFFLHALREQQIQVIGITVIACAATLYFVYRCFKGCEHIRILLITTMVWSAFFYKFGIFVLLFTLYVVIFLHNVRPFWDTSVKITCGVAAIFFVFWSNTIISMPQVNLKKMIDVLFVYPNVYKYFFKWLVKGWPIMTLILMLGCIILLLRYVSDRKDLEALFLPASLFLPVFVSSFFIAHPESRYLFHLYPLIVTIFSMVMVLGVVRIQENFPMKGSCSRSLLTALLVAVIFIISQDANPVNAWSIGDRTYRTAKDPVRSVITWEFYARYHQDFRSPSLHVKKHLSPEDEIISLGPLHMTGVYHYYTGNVRYTVVPPSLNGLLKGDKIVNYITSSEYITGVPELKKLISDMSGNIWILGDKMIIDEQNDFYRKPMKKYLRALTQNHEFIGSDDLTFAVKIR